MQGELTLSKGVKLWEDRTLHDLRADFEVRPDPKRPDKLRHLQLKISRGWYSSPGRPKAELPTRLSASFEPNGRVRLEHCGQSAV